MVDVLEQAGLALTYYAALVLGMRLAGKRLAGQTTTFDLIVLISMAVVLQTATLREGTRAAIVFVVVVFAAHRGLTRLCAASPRLRRLVRGTPRPLIQDGQVMWDALRRESMSYEELLAGLRKAGHPEPEQLRAAILEETGHISVVPFEAGAAPRPATRPRPVSAITAAVEDAGDAR